MKQYDIYVKTNNEDRIIVGKNNKWGVVDKENNVIVPVNYDDVRFYYDVYFMTTIKTDFSGYKYGLFDIDGNELLCTDYNDMDFVTKNIFKLRKDLKYAVYFVETKTLTEFKFDCISEISYKSDITCKTNGFWGVWDYKGNEVLPAKFNRTIKHTYNDGYICEINKKWGYYNKYGEKIIDHEFDKIIACRDGIYCFMKGKEGVYNLDGECIIPCKYFYVEKINDNLYLYSTTKKKIFGLIDKKGSIISEEKYTDIDRTSSCSFYLVQIGEKYNLINNKGEEIFSEQYEKIKIVLFDPYIFAVKKNDLWGLVDVKGNYILSPKYKDIFDFEQGLSYVITTDEKRGFIAVDGNEVIPAIYSGISRHEKGTFMVTAYGSKKGILEVSGKILLPIKYDHIFSIYEEYAEVELNKHKGIAYFNK